MNGSETKDERLLKADYHGCLLHVTGALNESQVGISGLVIRESRNIFLLLTPKDRLLSKCFCTLRPTPAIIQIFHKSS